MSCTGEDQGVEHEHYDYDIARRYMRGFGGLITFLVKGADATATARVIDAVRLPRIGPSLGGVESLTEQPIVMSYHGHTPEQRQAVGISDNMIRLACGIENADDLIAPTWDWRWGRSTREGRAKESHAFSAEADLVSTGCHESDQHV